MTATAAEPPRLDIGRVVSGTFGVLGRNFAPFAGLALLLVSIPFAIVGGGVAGLMDNRFILPGLGAIGLGVLAYLAAAAILQAALIYGTVRDLNGSRADFGQCLAMGLRACLPLILVSLLAWLGIFAGLMLFVVPGVMLGMAWCVAVPAQVAERTGIVGALGRSAELTRGNRWAIFGLTLLFLVMTWLVALLLSPLNLVLGALGSAGLVAAQLLVNGLSTGINTLVGATGLAVLYVELRRLKEGTEPEALAALFD
ncbi:MAG: hypothetical protein WCY15_13325 [Phenylobacterium sp.]|jgi:uncharacterized membrane protein|uniref:hypothetical protein n=1 Tax=Phenylobacterium sp. TaxID=1871053 RepID=UPI002A363B6A|nr:hypothetical protein [Phenylobacterium sp.]MDX9999595.1 hypothetical protein [Phenylobacterium sp.]